MDEVDKKLKVPVSKDAKQKQTWILFGSKHSVTKAPGI